MSNRTIYSFLFLLFLSSYLSAQCPSYTTTNTQTGTCNEAAGNINYFNLLSNITLTVNGNLTINGDFAVLGESLIVNGTLTITGAFTSGAGSSVVIGNGGVINSNSLASGLGATFTVQNGGTLNVTNDVGSGLFAAFTVNAGGIVNVGGNFTTGGQATMVIDGTVSVTGTFTNTTGGTLSGNGSLTAGTFTNAGTDNFSSGSSCSTCCGGGCAPLPVTLVYFKGNLDETGYATLDWQTATELNNSGFQIERSSNGKDFLWVGFVDGFGTSNVEHTYTYKDHLRTFETSYYRLKQIDFDGQFEYSHTILVINSEKEKFEVYPNPTNGIIRILNSINNYTLYDVEGHLLKKTSSTTNLQAEKQISEVLSYSKSGSYILVTEAGGKKQMVRIIKN